MEKKLHVVLALIFALCITTGVSAQDTTEKSETAKVEKKNRKGNKDKQQKRRLAKRVMKSASAVELTEDQQKKLADLLEENFESLMSMQKKMEGLIPKDNRKTLNAAVKKARGEGKKHEEAIAIGYEEIGLSKDDQESVQAITDERNELLAKIKKEIVATFSEDQKKAMKESSKSRKGKGKAKKDKKKSKKGEGEKKTDGETTSG